MVAAYRPTTKLSQSAKRAGRDGRTINTAHIGHGRQTAKAASPVPLAAAPPPQPAAESTPEPPDRETVDAARAILRSPQPLVFGPAVGLGATPARRRPWSDPVSPGPEAHRGPCEAAEGHLLRQSDPRTAKQVAKEGRVNRAARERRRTKAVTDPAAHTGPAAVARARLARAGPLQGSTRACAQRALCRIGAARSDVGDRGTMARAPVSGGTRAKCCSSWIIDLPP
jgi:hypothetical protein